MPDEKVSKLEIHAYDNAKFSGNAVRTFTAMFNPTNYTKKFTIEYTTGQGQGTSNAPQVFNKVKPGDLTLEFTIDGTNTVAPVSVSKDELKSIAAGDGDPVDVEAKIKEFRRTCWEYKGDLHRPYFLHVIWGDLSMECVLVSADIKYVLFDREGKPLRVKITATFSEAQADEIREKTEKNSSPDLTHIRIVQEGDTLPLMSKRIYGDSKYYLQVARANKLRDFRKLQAGQEIFFPPIDKTKNSNTA